MDNNNIFTKWALPNNICDLAPITRETTNKFVGRLDLVEEIFPRLISRSIIVIEGPIGVGKTSLGNYTRFESKQFTPTIEIKTNSTWSSDDFLLNLIVAILEELQRSGNNYGLSKDPLVKKISNKYQDFFTKTNNLSVGLPSFLTLGGGRGSSYSRATNSAVSLETDLKNLSQIIIKKLHPNKPIIFQLNNLDLDQGFSSDELKKLFDKIKDVLLLEGITWIITGTTGLFDILRKSIPKADQIIGTPIEIEPLSIQEVKDSFIKRAEGEGYSGVLPLSNEALLEIYKATNGIFRKMLTMINDLLICYSKVQLKMSIDVADIKSYYKSKKYKEIERFKRNKYQWQIIEFLSKNPGSAQNKIKTKPQIKDKANLSKEIKKLKDLGVVRTESRLGLESQCFLKNEYCFICEN